MRTVLRLVLLPVAIAFALAGCHGVDDSTPSGAAPTLPLQSAHPPKWSPTIEIPPPR